MEVNMKKIILCVFILLSFICPMLAQDIADVSVTDRSYSSIKKSIKKRLLITLFR